jgi:hypothetical protein
MAKREPKRKRKPKFRAATETRRLAREGVGTPRPSRQIPDKRLKAARHKKEIMPDEL